MASRFALRAAIGLLAAALCASPVLAQSTQTPISGLPAASALDGTEILPNVQGGTTKRTPVSALLPYLGTALPNFTPTTKGFAPASGGGTINFLRADGTWAAPPTGSGGGSAAPTDFFGYVAGGYYMRDQTIAGGAPGTNNVRLHPIIIRQTATLSGLALRVITASTAGNVQVAVYASSPTTLRPTGLPIATSASVSTATTGNIDATFTAQVQAQFGLYWVASVNDNNTATFAAITNLQGNTMSAVYGPRSLTDMANSSTAGLSGFTTTTTFGTWPDLTSATLTAQTSNGVPAAWFKVASVP